MERDIAQQTIIENQLLGYLLAALRQTIAWEVAGADWSRKLSTLRFLSQSFQRHLERLLELEEHDGYMAEVLKTAPALGKEIDALRNEHLQFRDALHRIVPRLERAGPADHARITALGEELLALMTQLEEHNRREEQILQEALLREEGGEGG